MKNKLTFKALSRWVAAPLLVASLFAWEVSPAYPGNVVSSATLPQKSNVAIKVAADNSSDVQDIKDRIKELESKERQNYALILDDQRKKIDWWFSFLAVLTAVMAISGGLIPFLMGRKDKEIIEQDKAQITKMKDEVEKLSLDAKNDADNLYKNAISGEEHYAKLKSYVGESESYLLKSSTNVVENKGVAATANEKVDDPILRLRTKAIEASEAHDAEKAYGLWNAVTLLNTADENAHFNASASAGLVSDSKLSNEKIYWLRLVQRHSEQSMNLNPNNFATFYNWGSALLYEANAVAQTDLSRAKELWRDAAEKFGQTLKINPRSAEAANNWGIVLDNQALAFAQLNDLQSAKSLWRESASKHELALSIDPKKAEAASNWGAVLANEALAILPADIKAARILFEQSIEKFKSALEIKPEFENAAKHLKLAQAELDKLDGEST